MATWGDWMKSVPVVGTAWRMGEALMRTPDAGNGLLTPAQLRAFAPDTVVPSRKTLTSLAQTNDSVVMAVTYPSGDKEHLAMVLLQRLPGTEIVSTMVIKGVEVGMDAMRPRVFGVRGGSLPDTVKSPPSTWTVMTNCNVTPPRTFVLFAPNKHLAVRGVKHIHVRVFEAAAAHGPDSAADWESLIQGCLWPLGIWGVWPKGSSSPARLVRFKLKHPDVSSPADRKFCAKAFTASLRPCESKALWKRVLSVASEFAHLREILALKPLRARVLQSNLKGLRMLTENWPFVPPVHKSRRLYTVLATLSQARVGIEAALEARSVADQVIMAKRALQLWYKAAQSFPDRLRKQAAENLGPYARELGYKGRALEDAERAHARRSRERDELRMLGVPVFSGLPESPEGDGWKTLKPSSRRRADGTRPSDHHRFARAGFTARRMPTERDLSRLHKLLSRR